VNEVRHVFPVMAYDIDFAGVLSNLVYVRWLEDLRILFAEQALPLGAALARGIAPALLRTEIDTLAPVRFPDQVEGRLWLLAWGRARWNVAAELISQATRVTTSRAKQTGVFVSTTTLRPVPLPAEFRQE
jgi:acyl-CoA thioester hydrolase